MAWIAALIGAAGSYLASDSAKSAAEKGSQNSGSSRLVPSDNTAGHMDRLLEEYIQLMDGRKQTGPQYFPGQPGGGGTSSQTQGLIDNLSNAEFLNEGFGGNMRAALDAQMGQSTAMQQAAFDEAQGYNPEYYDQAIQAMLAGGGADPNIAAAIEQMMSRGGGGGGSGAPARIDAKALGLGEASNDYDRSVLAGDFLGPDTNPWIQEYADTIRREGHETLVPMARADAAGARRYGSAAFANQENAAFDDINDQITSLYYNNYNDERGRQEGASNRVSALDSNKISAGASMSNAQTAAGASMSNANTAAMAQLLLGNAGLRMDGLNLAGGLIQGLSGTHLDRIGLMNQAAGQDQDFRLGTFDAANKNLGIELGSLQAGVQASGAADSRRQSGANSRYAADLNKWNYERDFQKNNTLEQLMFLQQFGAQFGTHETNNSSPVPYTGNPWAAALGGGLSGYQSAGGFNQNNNQSNQNSQTTLGQNNPAQDLWFQQLYGGG